MRSLFKFWPRKAYITVLLLLCVITPLTQAQLGASPLVILMNGDLHAWDNGQLFRLTNNLYNYDMRMAPGGRYVAYIATSPQAAVFARSIGPSDGILPSDIFIYDLQLNNIIPVAIQPADVLFTTDNNDDKFIARSRPAWSADGTMLAWSEIDVPGFEHRLMRYDIRTGAVTRVYATQSDPYAFSVPASALWLGDDRLLTRDFLYNDSLNRMQTVYSLYDLQGNLLNTVWVSEDSYISLNVFEIHAADTTADMVWVGIQYSSGLWEIIDPASGIRQELTQPPQMFSMEAISSVGLSSVADLNAVMGLIYAWDVALPGQTSAQRLPFNGAPDEITIAPDGQQIAYIAADGVYTWQNQQAQRIPGTEVIAGDAFASLVWSAPIWQLSGYSAALAPTTAPVVSTSGAFTCPGFALPSRLIVGQQARVTADNDIPNNMRSGASAATERIGQIPAGGVFETIGGPVCAENTIWWQVRHGVLTGWTAEGGDNAYWLEPFTTPTASSQAQSYVVQRGDILARIAQEFNVSVNCMIQTNSLTNPNRLIPGQVLVIDPAACN